MTYENGGNNPDFESVTTEELDVTEQSAKIFSSSSQSISNSTVTTLQFDSEDTGHTQGDVLTVDLSNNKITVEQAGLYLIKTSVEYPSPGDGTRLLIRDSVGVTTDHAYDTQAGANNLTTVSTIGMTVIASPPTDIEVETFQDSGGSISTNGSSGTDHFEVAKLG